MTPDLSNPQFDLAVRYVDHTAKHLFLTGKAGTGKTTFLRYIREHSPKRLAVLAPTGVAAINAGGMTIHSFFQLPFGTFLPTDNLPKETTGSQFYNEKSLLRELKLNGDKRKMIKNLDLLIIDEVSMVRADLLDAIDAILRNVRNQPFLPFGGVQMLFIGDLFQLPPVVKEEDQHIIGQYYKSPFFFHAQALKRCPPIYLELKKIYRQKDEAFVKILNNVRNDEVTREDLEVLNTHYRPDQVPEKKEQYITLTTHNHKAQKINKDELGHLKGKEHVFHAEVVGEFHERAYPADQVLYLKEGAQVMFIKNDKSEEKRYFNGKIGTISKIDPDSIHVAFPKEQNELLVDKEVWRNLRYRYDPEKDKIVEEELGTFTQYPIRLAWAITIHKSQGLTFEKAIVDAGQSFAPGQVYVALSRLTSLKGLILHSPITPSAIHTEEEAIAFGRTEMPMHLMEESLIQAQKEYIHALLLEIFNWQKTTFMLDTFSKSFLSRRLPFLDDAAQLAKDLLQKCLAQQKIAIRFNEQLIALFPEAQKDRYEKLHERVEAAGNYFTNALKGEILAPLEGHLADVGKISKIKSYLKDLREMIVQIKEKIAQLEKVIQITAGLRKGTNAEKLLQQIREQDQDIRKSLHVEEKATEKAEKPAKGASQRLTLEMFRNGKTVEEIAKLRFLAVGTIESHLISFIPTGEIKITELVTEEKMNIILTALEAAPDKLLAEHKEALGEAISYCELKAVKTFYLNGQESTMAKD